MISGIAFNIIGFGILIGNIYAGLRMFSLALKIRKMHSGLIGKGWNGKLTQIQLKKLNLIITDENSKENIRQFLFYSKMSKNFIIAGFSLLFIIVFLSNIFNGK